MNRPNIILIGLDTTRADYFNKDNTPNLHKLAEDGINFTNAFSSTIRTDPGFTSVFTGKHPVSHGILRHGMNVTNKEKENIKHSIFLPEVLKELGYKTYAVDWLRRWHKRGIDHYSGKLNEDVSSGRFKKLHKIILKLFH